MPGIITAEDIYLAVKKTQQFLEKSYKVTTSARQKLSLVDPGVKGPTWICKTSFPATPESNICEIVATAISQLGDGREHYLPAPLSDVPIEWVGYRAGPRAEDLEPLQISDMESRDKYDSMMREITNNTVTLYVAGGAF